MWRVSSDHIGRRLAQVVAMDAKKYYSPFMQFNNDDVRRELDKVMLHIDWNYTLHCSYLNSARAS